MKRKQIVERIAKEREVPLHTAADWLDSFLYELMQQLKGAPPGAEEAQAPPSDTQRRAPK